MSITRPIGEQIRFLSSLTGDHVLDTYLEAAEYGSRTLADLLGELFDSGGNLVAFNFRFNSTGTDYSLDYRIGTGAWTPIVDFAGFYTSIDAAQTAAEAAQAAAELALDEFTDIYLGAKAADPALDNDGDALTAGDLYFNTTANVMKAYNGATWVTISVADVSSVFGRTGDVVALAGDYDGLALNLQDQTLTRPVLKDYSSTEYDLGTTSGSLTFDLENGNYQTVVINGNVTSVTLNNWSASGTRSAMTIRIDQDGTGGRTITGFPGSVSWFGREPALSGRGPSERDVILLTTSDGGVTIEGYWVTDEAIVAGTL